MLPFSDLSLLAFAQPTQGGQQPNALLSFLPFVFIVVIFYFLLIRPARKRQKALDEMVAALKPGDRVMTTGGIYGTVVAVAGDRVQLRIAEQVKIDVAKSAVSGMDTESAS